MDQIFLGMLATFGFNFAPQGWAFCNGQLISIANNSALFALLGTTFGGDGINTFALPNLQSRASVSIGDGPGLSSRTIGEVSGSENVTLISAQIPAHTHFMTASGDGPTQATAQGASLGSQGRAGGTMPNIYANGATSPVSMPSVTSTPTGGGQAHSNMQPYLAVNYSIALEGIYPARN